VDQKVGHFTEVWIMGEVLVITMHFGVVADTKRSGNV